MSVRVANNNEKRFSWKNEPSHEWCWSNKCMNDFKICNYTFLDQQNFSKRNKAEHEFCYKWGIQSNIKCEKWSDETYPKREFLKILSRDNENIYMCSLDLEIVTCGEKSGAKVVHGGKPAVTVKSVKIWVCISRLMPPTVPHTHTKNTVNAAAMNRINMPKNCFSHSNTYHIS